MGTHAEQLRDALVDELLEAGMVRTPRVEMAMRTVPRHVFLPGTPLRRAYANEVVQTKRDADGVPISAASQPSIVGAMLEQLGVSPGMRILEIGAGTGYNAALLAYLTGDRGEVVTVDVDDDIVAGGSREGMGIYVSGHPIDDLVLELRRRRACTVAEAKTRENQNLLVGGCVMDCV